MMLNLTVLYVIVYEGETSFPNITFVDFIDYRIHVQLGLVHSTSYLFDCTGIGNWQYLYFIRVNVYCLQKCLCVREKKQNWNT